MQSGIKSIPHVECGISAGASTVCRGYLSKSDMNSLRKKKKPFFYMFCFEHILLINYSKGLGTSSDNLLVPPLHV
jgi:hypothetical protein